MKMRLPQGLFICLVGLMALPAWASDIKKGMNFLIARQLLLQENWLLVNGHINIRTATGVERQLLDRKIVEVEICSPNKTCIFNYKRVQYCLRVKTKGDVIETMVVLNWSNSCAIGR